MKSLFSSALRGTRSWHCNAV